MSAGRRAPTPARPRSLGQVDRVEGSGSGAFERRPAIAGLCDSCAHQQVVRNTRGSVFSLCRRSRTEPDRFPRYPRVPVVECQGWDERPPGR